MSHCSVWHHGDTGQYKAKSNGSVWLLWMAPFAPLISLSSSSRSSPVLPITPPHISIYFNALRAQCAASTVTMPTIYQCPTKLLESQGSSSVPVPCHVDGAAHTSYPRLKTVIIVQLTYFSYIKRVLKYITNKCAHGWCWRPLVVSNSCQ